MRVPTLALALALAFATAGCSVDWGSRDFHTRLVGISSVASAPWDVRVSFEQANATVHEQTVRVPANDFRQLDDHSLPQGDYVLRANTSAREATRTLPLERDAKGITISVGEGGTLAISIIG